MKICIYGAGAIGGFFGARLALAGHEPSLIARGAHLAAMRNNGLTLISGGEEHTVAVRCSASNPWITRTTVPDRAARTGVPTGMEKSYP